jgi:TrmH family RNA methyltransferase
MLTKSQVKYIQSLSQKKFRDSENAFVAEGQKIINDLLDAGNVRPLHIYAMADWLKLQGHLDMETVEVNEKELERISFLKSPQQALAVFEKPIFPDFEPKTALKGNLTLMLDSIQDPGNLGSLIRTADWFGIRQIISSKNSADPFSPKIIQSTMGSIARVRVMQIDLVDFLNEQDPSIPVFSTVLEGKSLYQMEAVPEAILIIGNESRGISPGLISLSSLKITIPKIGQSGAESLNASVAAAVVIAWLRRPGSGNGLVKL